MRTEKVSPALRATVKSVWLAVFVISFSVACEVKSSCAQTLVNAALICTGSTLVRAASKRRVWSSTSTFENAKPSASRIALTSAGGRVSFSPESKKKSLGTRICAFELFAN